jgi:hypothetical protein
MFVFILEFCTGTGIVLDLNFSYKKLRVFVKKIAEFIYLELEPGQKKSAAPK